MKAPAFDYVAPRTLDEALRALSEVDNARVLAGGQSLVAMLNMRFAFPDCLVDINGIQELSFIREAGHVVEIGAMARQRDVEFSPLVERRLPILREAILNVGHRQTRNRGTVGGSLCQLDPSAEIPTIAMAMDACVTAASVRGRREIRMADFPAGYMTPSLQPDEILVALSIRPWPAGHGYAFEEYARRHGDFAIVSAAVLLEFDAQGIVGRASVTLGGIGSMPVKVLAAEQVLLGSRALPADIDAAAAHCGQVEASSDSYVPGWYRKHLAQVLCRRALAKALSRAER
ncbi:xanthine dehydrogenase family protein subunit M [Ramlibacter sp. AW1]|uniref:Xanthine dehydrogenase family protein subunit M n=1 Tax=Ramlibacter aurantiacus TaxID=2801330 RepID=A0A936ZQ41_9BURK|nr:xanthine dehydrogenase family protein subunit M [Ramlibacter aurantiacus]MBL0421495.1 xanthine dehydrogenase family protein subunit M [Ramlibacter aurantiacus]